MNDCKGAEAMRNFIKGLVLMLTLSLLVGCVSIPIGDGKSMKVSKEGVSVKSKDGNENQELSFDVDEESGSFSIDGKDEDGQITSMQMEETTEIPDEFPKDIPIPDAAEVESALNIDVGDVTQSVVYLKIESRDLSEFEDMYKAYGESQGYEELLNSNTEGFLQLAMQGDTSSLTVTAQVENEDTGEIALSLKYQENHGEVDQAE